MSRPLRSPVKSTLAAARGHGLVIWGLPAQLWARSAKLSSTMNKRLRLLGRLVTTEAKGFAWGTLDKHMLPEVRRIRLSSIIRRRWRLPDKLATETTKQLL